MTKRIYELDGKRISSGNVCGFVHVARTDRGFCAGACGTFIFKGTKYVELNVFCPADPICLDCYVANSHPDTCILGVKTIPKTKYQPSKVICKDFSVRQKVSQEKTET